MFRRIISLFIIATVLSSCGVYRRVQEEKMTDVQLANAINRITDDKLCYQLYPISYGDHRWQSFALSEAASRGLGDCNRFTENVLILYLNLIQ
jgi:hypothetical protein